MVILIDFYRIFNFMKNLNITKEKMAIDVNMNEDSSGTDVWAVNSNPRLARLSSVFTMVGDVKNAPGVPKDVGVTNASA